MLRRIFFFRGQLKYSMLDPAYPFNSPSVLSFQNESLPFAGLPVAQKGYKTTQPPRTTFYIPRFLCLLKFICSSCPSHHITSNSSALPFFGPQCLHANPQIPNPIPCFSERSSIKPHTSAQPRQPFAPAHPPRP